MKRQVYEVIIVNNKTNNITYTTIKGKTPFEARELAESLYKTKDTRVTLGSVLEG